MMKKVYISGFNGNMASRYKAILKLMGIGVIGKDLNCEFGRPKDADGFIIATPTENHIDDLEKYIVFGKPILVEKPITKFIFSLDSFAEKWKDKLDLITMVNQYRYLYDPLVVGDTYYNYFKTGKDSLHWDCINIIGSAKARLELRNDSPIWQCTINGRHLKIHEMDHAYCNMIKDWISGELKGNWEYIKHAHLAVTKCLQS